MVRQVQYSGVHYTAPYVQCTGISLVGPVREAGSDHMELIWIVLCLLALDVAALLFAVDTRPGFPPPPRHRPPAALLDPRSPARPRVGPGLGRRRLLRRRPVPPPPRADGRLLEPGRGHPGAGDRPRPRGSPTPGRRDRLGPGR